MTDYIRIGIVSTARINELGILRPRSKQGKVVAIASEKMSQADLYARYGLEHCFTSYDDLIHFDGIDAVYISLPNSLHFKYALQALKAKKHVLCEKPIVLKVSELKILEQEAIKQNVFLMDGLHYYYYPPLVDVMSKIDRSAVVKIDCFLGFPYPKNPKDIRLRKKLGGGATSHLGCYATHFMTWLLPEALWSLRHYDVKMKEGVDLEANYHFASNTNVISNFQVTFDYPVIDSWVKVYFQDGKYLQINHAFTPTTFYDEKNPAQNVFSLEGVLGDQKFESTKTTYEYQFEEFFQGIQLRKRPQIFIQAYEILEKCLKAIESKS